MLKKALERNTGVRAHIIDTQTREEAQDKNKLCSPGELNLKKILRTD